MMRLLTSIASLLILIASARLTIDIGLDVPVSMQSLAVCLVAYFDRSAIYVVLSYLLLGGLGLPVFADGIGGWEVLIGSSCGYLVGFLLATAYMRFRLVELASNTQLLQILTLATIIILTSGFVWLTLVKSVSVAWTYGVLPYILGAVVKVFLAYLIILVYRQAQSWPRLT